MRDSKAGKFTDNIAFADFSLLGAYSMKWLAGIKWPAGFPIWGRMVGWLSHMG